MPYFDHNRLITSRRVIALNYFKSWFIIDLTSAVPMQLFEMTILDKGVSNANLLKLTRLPRIYRLLRIARILKVFRVVRKMQFINKLKENLNLTLGFHRMI